VEIDEPGDDRRRAGQRRYAGRRDDLAQRVHGDGDPQLAVAGHNHMMRGRGIFHFATGTRSVCDPQYFWIKSVNISEISYHHVANVKLLFE